MVNDNSFPRRARITKTDEFSSVFSFRKRISGQYLALHYQPNQLGWPRLGMIVSKKTVRLSVDRNYMKRVVRELFRTHRLVLPAADIVVRMLKPFKRSDYPVIREEFAALLEKLLERAGKPA